MRNTVSPVPSIDLIQWIFTSHQSRENEICALLTLILILILGN